MSIKRKEELRVRIIANTLKQSKKRPDNIVTIAGYIEELAGLVNGLKEVSNMVEISVGMLKKFLDVNKLSVKTKELVKQRKIDSVQIVHDLAPFSYEEQLFLANKVIDGELSSTDTRSILPYRKRNPELDIKEVINNYFKSKNIKIYSILFELPEGININQITTKIKKLVPELTIHAVIENGKEYKIQLKKEGIIALRNEAKKNKVTLNQLISNIIIA